jgi:hypothetical protein
MVHEVEHLWSEWERIIWIFVGERHSVLIDAVWLVNVENLDVVRKRNHTSHLLLHIVLLVPWCSGKRSLFGDAEHLDIIAEFSEVNLLIEYHLLLQKLLALLCECFDDGLVFAWCNFATVDWLAVRYDQVADVSGVTNGYLGHRWVDLDAVLDVGD